MIFKVQTWSNPYNPMDTTYCFICDTPELETTVSCNVCSQLWCVTCNRKLNRCPFCRNELTKRYTKTVWYQVQEIEDTLDYLHEQHDLEIESFRRLTIVVFILTIFLGNLFFTVTAIA